MEGVIREHIASIEFGEVQGFQNVAIVPLFSKRENAGEYLILSEAIERGVLTISEVSEGGHVPELKVVNTADVPVLILDGEELFGAKQNRVLNTTVLLKAHSTTIVSVSCTEHGRWSYTTATFKESGHFMSRDLRSVKNRSVQRSLEEDGQYVSDQHAIWDGIHVQGEQAKVHSTTGAMRDIHEARRDDLQAFVQKFPYLPNQKGIMVYLEGHVVGLDMVSSVHAYELLHDKLIRSYVLEAILNDPKQQRKPSLKKATAFIEAILACEIKRFDSVGHGQDVRFKSQRLCGAALEFRETIIHLAVFNENRHVQQGGMSSFRRRQANLRSNGIV